VIRYKAQAIQHSNKTIIALQNSVCSFPARTSKEKAALGLGLLWLSLLLRNRRWRLPYQ
jgi:hypothetical protein